VERERACAKCGGNLEAASKFCPHCGQEAAALNACPACGDERSLGARFCPGCGADLSSAAPRVPAREPVVVAEAASIRVPLSGVTIEFPFSGAQTFDMAVADAGRFATFTVMGEGKKALHRVTFSSGEIDAALPLVNLLKGWRGRTVYVDGVKLPWDDAFAFKSCFERRQSSYKPDAFCFGEEQQWSQNIWGCMQSQMPWSEHADWFCHGHFVDNKGTWEFDKPRLRHDLQRNLFRFRLCPAMDAGLVEQLLSAFPDRVNPRLDANWKFVEDWSGTNPNTIAFMRKTSWGDKEEVRAKGVAPVGVGAARQMASRLKRQLPVG
jgi:hypothetical protein